MATVPARISGTYRPPQKPKPAPRPAADAGMGSLLRALQQPANTAGLQQQANQAAARDTNAMVQALRAEQDRINAQAAARAGQMQQAGLASARYLESLNLGGSLGDSLRSSAADQATLAQGFSGQLRDTVGGEAAKVQQGLQAIGAPGGAPNIGTDQAANVLYGLGGQLPANAMLQAAPFAEAQARQLPATLLGQGQTYAAGQLARGREQADTLSGKIAETVGGRAGLAREYLADLQAQAEKSRQNAISNVFQAIRLEQSGQKAAADQAWRAAQLEQDNADRALREWKYQQDVALGQQRVDVSRELGQQRITQGNERLEISRGQLEVSRGQLARGIVKDKQAAAAKKQTGGMTADTWRTLVSDATKQARSISTSQPARQRFNTSTGGFEEVPGTAREAAPYQEALRQILALGPSTPRWKAKATQIVNAQYAEGENGRPYSPKKAQAVSAQAARAAYNAGVPFDEAVATFLANTTGTIPKATAVDAYRRIYFFASPFSPIPGSKNFPPRGGN